MSPRAEQPSQEQIVRKRSFDPLASVDLMRFDLRTFGEILPETYERVCDEQLSYIVEGINRASRTEFRLRRDENDELVYFDRGEWLPYKSLLYTGWKVAEAEAEADPRRQFLAEWAARDWEMGMRMDALRPGESMLWSNSFPHEARARYGDRFLEDCGLQPKRRLGFIYHAVADEDGSLILRTQTVDRSDPEAFAAVDALLDYDPAADLDTAVRTYDGVLRKREGGQFFAGRRNSELNENAWQEVTRQKGLIDFMLNRLAEIAATTATRQQLEAETKRLIIGTWKLFKEQLDTVATPALEGAESYGDYQRAVNLATERAISQQDFILACGGVVRAEIDPNGPADFASLSLDEAFKQIFGEASNTSGIDYKFDKRMYCVVCQAPPSDAEKKSQSKKLCGPCGICKGCDSKLRAKSRGGFALAA